MYGQRNNFFSVLFRIFAVIALICSFGSVGLAIQNGSGGGTYNALTNPMTSNTLNTPLTEPVSSYQTYNAPILNQGLPNENAIITGNVGGLQYFHGSVPYTNPLNFRGSLETTSLDSFLRASTPSSEPFYSPTGYPGSSTVPGAAGFLSAPSEKVVSGNSTYTQDYFIPLSQLAAGVQSAIPTDLQHANPNIVAGQYNTIMNNVQGYRSVDQFVQQGSGGEIQITQGDIDTLQRDSSLLKSEIDSFEPADTLEPFNQEKRSVPPTQNNAFGESGTTPAIDQIPDLTAEQMQQTSGYMDLYAQGNEKVRKEIEEQWRQKLETAEVGLKKTSQTRDERRARIAQTSGATSEQSESRTSRYVDFQKEFGDKFDHFIKAAQQYLKEGKFYQAADSYSMASVYRQFDPNAYVGKAIALFAAGEYLSSSRVLAYGLRLDVDTVKNKIDLEQLLGDDKLLILRIQDLQKWAAISESDELVFLFSYVSYQTGKYILAESAIDAALQKKPASKVYLALKEAIKKARAM